MKTRKPIKMLLKRLFCRHGEYDIIGKHVDNDTYVMRSGYGVTGYKKERIRENYFRVKYIKKCRKCGRIF